MTDHLMEPPDPGDECAAAAAGAVPDASASASVSAPNSAAKSASALDGTSPRPTRRRRKQRPPRSPAQIQASQLNGSRSRGPITPEGRHQAKFNALKHGLCAATILLPGEKSELFA